MSNEPDIRALITELNSKLGPTLVAALAGSKDHQASKQWEAGTASPTDREAERIRFALGIWHKIAEAEGDDVARLWFMGANPWLNDDPAVWAIHQDRFGEVENAANAMVNGAFNG